MKAICLYSGGLDSALAVKIIKEIGIEPFCIRFITPFIKKELPVIKKFIKRENLTLLEIETPPDYLDILKSSKYGFGKNLNPCIDCKIYFLKKAKEIMLKEKADFIVTGEVLNQRTMSQKESVLRLIEKEANLEGLVLRPLSARLLPITIPEKEGKVNREKFFSIRAKSRKIQLELARKYFLKEFTTPAGGCLLTDPSFCRRLKDLLVYNPEFSLKDIELLKLGKHYRISKNAKLIIPRSKQEESRLLHLKDENDFLVTEESISIKALVKGFFSEEDFVICAQIFLEEFKRFQGRVKFTRDLQEKVVQTSQRENIKEKYRL